MWNMKGIQLLSRPVWGCILCSSQKKDAPQDDPPTWNRCSALLTGHCTRLHCHIAICFGQLSRWTDWVFLYLLPDLRLLKKYILCCTLLQMKSIWFVQDRAPSTYSPIFLKEHAGFIIWLIWIVIGILNSTVMISSLRIRAFWSHHFWSPV